jgi:hypothetical protein
VQKGVSEMTRKYKMIPEGNLFRIKALVDLPEVKAGDLDSIGRKHGYTTEEIQDTFAILKAGCNQINRMRREG